MIDTERSLESLAKLHSEIMKERAEGLREAALSSRSRLVEREEALARLRVQVAMLKESLKAAPAAAPVRAPAPAPIAAVVRAVPAPAVRPAPAARGFNWQSLAPYAAIAACAVFIEIGGPNRPASAAPNIAALAQPAPVVIQRERVAAKGAPVVTDDDRSQEAMLLVHEWKLPGDEKSLGERLGGEIDLPGTRPAWKVERTGARDYRVTFQRADKDIPYAFEADIEARVVMPTPETQALLAPRFTAAVR
ncbi:MAG: hypothetical protein COV48_15765 [Elusimicrobia bacterium CG11_big_fil_rev_8_21_14_0_20_64_6]|nr:MAG: hypothetical protein COV48_15765 [Elusimicrobia bacterium CG11_big_fil_rev_8_21_14_0_20_64_6]